MDCTDRPVSDRALRRIRDGRPFDPPWSTKRTADPGPIHLADAGNGLPLDGEVAEVIVYDRTLDDAEMAAVSE